MRKWYSPTVIAAGFIFTFAIYQRLPDQIATHWDMNGDVNGWSSRPFGGFILPGISLLLWFALRLLPRIDPRRENYAKFQGTYDLVVDGVVTFLVLAHVAMLGHAIGWKTPIARIAPAGVGALLVLLGNVLPRLRANWWMGIRTPWTLSSDTVWTKTHRVGGYVFMAAGLACLVGAALPAAWPTRVMFVAIVGAGLATTVYSYVAWRQEQRRGTA
jgi:uncharacterized membrane protein